MTPRVPFGVRVEQSESVRQLMRDRVGEGGVLWPGIALTGNSFGAYSP